MNSGNIIRISILIALILLAQVQLTFGQKRAINGSKITEIPNGPVSMGNIGFDLEMPIFSGSASKKEVEAATKLMRLPTWSAGYASCDSQQSEVSCLELHKAAKTILNYEKSVKDGTAKGHVLVKISNHGLPDRMSMLYHGLSIAMATNRILYTNTSMFPFKLPSIVKSADDSTDGIELPTDYQFGCANVSPKYQKLMISNSTWPQALYTHHVIAPFLRESFSFHAAYFLGNYLFGTDENNDCVLKSKKNIVEAWKFAGDRDMMSVGEYSNHIGRCGLTGNDNDLITNDRNSQFDKNKYQEILNIEDDEDSISCSLYKMMSYEKIIHTFGSRLGFWASAMQGRKGGFMNGIDRICINVTNSQCGSLWHTYCPADKHWLYRTNNRMFVCGPNVNDVRLYIEYLLW